MGILHNPASWSKNWRTYIGTFDGLAERKKAGSAEEFMDRFICCAKECQWSNAVAGAALQMQLTGNASLWYQARKFENELKNPGRAPSPEEWKEKIIRHYSVTRTRDDVADIRKALCQEDDEEAIAYAVRVEACISNTHKVLHPRTNSLESSETLEDDKLYYFERGLRNEIRRLTAERTEDITYEQYVEWVCKAEKKFKDMGGEQKALKKKQINEVREEKTEESREKVMDDKIMEINKIIKDLKSGNTTVGDNKNQKKSHKDGGNYKKTYKNNKGAEKTCYRCRAPGHFARNCRVPADQIDKIGKLQAQIEEIRAVYGVTNEETQDF